MIHLLDYQLNNKNQILINQKDVEYQINNDVIVFKDQFGEQQIDIKNKKYAKNNQEYQLTIDINENICHIVLTTGEKISFNCPSSLENNNNEINIKYQIEEQLELKIIMKGKK